VPDPVNSGFWVRGVKDTVYRNLNIQGGVFGLRYCENVTVEQGQVYGNNKGDNCLVGGEAGHGMSKNIVIRNIYFHDMTISDPSQHHQALYVSNVDGLTIEGCKFERIYGNTADLFFTGWEVPGNATNIRILNNWFLPPTNPSRDDAIQWNDVNGGFKNFTIEGNLFDGAQPYFGTLNKQTTNFVVGVNYGTTPSQAVIDKAKGLGVKFTELPFRPKSQWPGQVGVPPPPPPPPPPPVTPEEPPTPPPPSETDVLRARLAEWEAWYKLAPGQAL
jgi:hypothetical protein